MKHRLLDAALDALGPDYVYRKRLVDEERLWLDAHAEVRVALAAVDLILPLIARAEERDDARAVVQALAAAIDDPARELPAHARWWGLGDDTPEGVIGLAFSALWALRAGSYAAARYNERIVAAVARLSSARAAEPRPPALLALLARWILRGELELALRHRHPTLLARVSAILFRAGPATSAVWLVRVDDGALALLRRSDGELLVVEGRDEDVLAAVPDSLFAAAVAAVRSGR